MRPKQFHKATGKKEQETRDHFSSLAPNAARLNSLVRQHWGIENTLHWVLDVAFGENLSRKRAANAAQNFCLLDRIALNLPLALREPQVGSSLRGVIVQDG